MDRRRLDGTGSKDYLPSGKIRCRVRINGERVTRIFDADQEAEADTFLDGTHAALVNGRLSAAAPTLGRWGQRWVNGLLNRSAAADQSRWRSMIAPAPIAALELHEITRPDVVEYLRWLGKQRRQENVAGAGSGKKHSSAKARGDQPLSAQSKRHALGLLRRCLSAAADEGIIGSNPAIGVRLPRAVAEKLKAPPWTYLEQEEIEQVLGCALLPEEVRLRYQVAIYTGLRQGDLWALDWRSLDLKRGRLDIVVEKNGEPLKAPLLPRAWAALKRLHQLAGEPKAGLVFPAPKGGRRGETDDGGWATRKKGGEARTGHRELAGIERRVRFHDLRHTCATHLLRGTWGRKWSLEEVKEFLAHSSVVVTQRYVHAAGALDAAAAATSGSRLGHARPKKMGRLPSVGPVGLEPTTNGLKVLPSCEGSPEVRPEHDPLLTREERLAVRRRELAQRIVERAAAGSAARPELEALARAVLRERRPYLARQILRGGEWALAAGLELAGLELGRAPAAAAPARGRVGS